MQGDFGRLVRERRESLGLTQADLARLLGMDTAYLCRVEKGKVVPDESVLLRMWRVTEDQGGVSFSCGSADRLAEMYHVAHRIPSQVTNYLLRSPNVVRALMKEAEKQIT